MLSDNGMDFDHWKTNVGFINDSIDNTYMVSIVNLKGEGVSSLSEELISIRNADYFMDLAIPYITITHDDGITGQPAVVCVVPIKQDGKLFGYINHYIDFNGFNMLFGLEGNDISNGYVLAEKSGQVLLKNGSANKFVGTNIFELINDSSVDGLTMDDIRNNINNNKSQKFVLSTEQGEYLIITAPTDISGWVYINVIDYNYFQNLLSQKVKDEKKMVGTLVVFCLLTILVVMFVVVYNKTKDLQANKALENKADTDLLTGLNNKIATERKIAECLNREKTSQHLLLLFDVDNFKKINDTMGHAFGDTVLKTLGEQLTQEFRKTDILGRLGGDEFAILIRDLKSDDILIKECNRIIEFFSQFKAGDYVKYSATASIGAAIYPRDGKTFEELYKSADGALYESKKQGKNRLTYANKELTKQRLDKEKAAKEEASEQ